MEINENLAEEKCTKNRRIRQPRWSTRKNLMKDEQKERKKKGAKQQDEQPDGTRGQVEKITTTWH